MGAKLFNWPSLFSSPDEAAMWRVKHEDDPEAFAELVRRWQKPIQNLCTRMLGDAHRGEDLAQDTFARLFAKRKVYEARSKFSTFLWRIALNLCYDELRKLKRRGEYSLDEPSEDGSQPHDVDSGAPCPHDDLVGQERASAVRDALQRIAEPYRVVLVLRHYEGLKFREIADVLEIPEGTVKSRMAEGLSQLGKLLHPLVSEAGPGTLERLSFKQPFRESMIL
jgi:RNA polymerase sigma-70 factor (ECF subfamily)